MTSFTQHLPDPRFAPAPAVGYTDRRVHVAVAGSFAFVSLLGAAVAVMAIVAMNGSMLTAFVPSLAVMAVGATLLVEGLGLGVRFREVRRATDTVKPVAGGAAVGVELIAGIGTLLLGALALFGVAPVLMLVLATIAYGAAFVLGSGGAFHFGLLSGPARRSDDVAVRSLVATYVSARPIAGMAALILGVLAVTDVGQQSPMTFVLIALVCVGAAAVLGGLALGGAARKSLV